MRRVGALQWVPFSVTPTSLLGSDADVCEVWEDEAATVVDDSQGQTSVYLPEPGEKNGRFFHHTNYCPIYILEHYVRMTSGILRKFE